MLKHRSEPNYIRSDEKEKETIYQIIGYLIEPLTKSDNTDTVNFLSEHLI